MPDAPLAPSNGSKLGLILKRGAVLAVPALIIAGTFVGLSTTSAMAPKPEEKEDLVEALPVVATRAEATNVQLSVRSQGVVQARSQVVLSPEVTGRVSYVSPNFLAGGHFNRGDVLLRLDPTEFELRVVQAQANVAQAETTLAREQSEARNARVEADELGITDVSDLALRQPQVAEAQARLASAKAALSEAELQLSRTVIRAPFDGRIISRAVDRGAFVTTGSQLASIFSTDVVEIPISLTDNDLDVLDLAIGFEATANNPGPEVRLSAMVAGEIREWTGEIKRTASVFDADTRVLFAYVEVQDPFGAGADDGVPLATGLFVSAEIEGPSVERAVTIPRTALRGTDRVYVVENNETLHIREVEVRSSDRAKVVLASGLSAGEVVITSPVRSPAEGMTVRPVDNPSEAEANPAVLASVAESRREE